MELYCRPRAWRCTTDRGHGSCTTANRARTCVRAVHGERCTVLHGGGVLYRGESYGAATAPWQQIPRGGTRHDAVGVWGERGGGVGGLRATWRLRDLADGLFASSYIPATAGCLLVLKGFMELLPRGRGEDRKDWVGLWVRQWLRAADELMNYTVHQGMPSPAVHSWMPSPAK